METTTAPYKSQIVVEKWEPDDDVTQPPSAIETIVSWHESNGEEITDPERIADIEAGASPDKE